MNINQKKVFAAACICLSFFGIAIVTLGSVLPALIEKFKLDQVGAGFITTILPAGILAGSLIFGPIVDKFGYRLLLIISTFAIIAGIEGVAFANNLTVLQFSLLLIGISGGALNGSSNALVADISSENKSASLNLLGVFFGIGALGMPALLGVLSPTYSFEKILMVTGIVIGISLVYFLFVKFPQPKQTQGFPLLQGFKLIREPILLILSIILFFESGLEGILTNWSTTYLQEVLAIEPGIALFSLTCLMLGLTIARIIIGIFLTKLAPFKILIASLLIGFTGLVLLYFSNNSQMAIFAMCLIGFGVASVFPTVLGYIGQLYAGLSGTAFSIAFFIALIGNTLLNYSVGLVSAYISLEKYPLILLLCFIVLCVLMFIGLTNLKKRIKI